MRRNGGIPPADRINNKEIKRTTGIIKVMLHNTEQKMLTWYRHMRRVGSDR